MQIKQKLNQISDFFLAPRINYIILKLRFQDVSIVLKKIEENIWKSFIRGYILNNPPWIQYWARQDASMIIIGHCVPWNVHLRCYSFDLANKGLQVQFCWSGTIYYSFKEKIKHQMITKTNERLKRPFLKNCFIINELSNTTRENSF